MFILVMVVSTLSTFLWAAWAEVDVIVRTEGQIIPARKSQLVQHLEGGIVRFILVQEGEVVNVGQPLLELSDVQTRSDLDQERSSLSSLQGREARLFAEVSGATEIAFPQELEDEAVMTVELSAWNARKDQLDRELQVLRAQSAQKQNELAEMRVKRRNLTEELDLAERKHGVIVELQKNNAASELEVLDSQIRIQRLRTELDDSDKAIPRLEAALTESRSREQESVARFRAEASSALTQVREHLEKVRRGIGSSADRLARNVVRSPVAGLINRLNVSTIGAVIRPSEVLLEITPSDDRILIQTRSNPDDRANLRKGLAAKVRVGAYDYSTYGTFAGHVTEVSSDTLTDERGFRYYRVNVEVDVASHSEGRRKPGILMPGMAATADITVGKRTILSYILSPLLEFRDGAFRSG